MFFLNDRQGWIVGKHGTVLGTVDGGRSWQLLNDTDFSRKRETFWSEHLLFTDERHGMVGVCCGECSTGGTWLMHAWVTSDGGRTWAMISHEEAEKTDLMKERTFETSRGELWTVFHQADVGYKKIGEESWHSAMKLIPGQEGWYRDVWFSSPKTGCMASNLGLYRTVDGGATWSRRTGFEGEPTLVRMTSDADITISVGPRLHESHDGGQTWSEAWSGPSDIVGLTYLPSGAGIAIGKGGLILRRSVIISATQK